MNKHFTRFGGGLLSSVILGLILVFIYSLLANLNVDLNFGGDKSIVFIKQFFISSEGNL